MATLNETVAITYLSGIEANGALMDLMKINDFPIMIFRANGMVIAHDHDCVSYYQEKQRIMESLFVRSEMTSERASCENETTRSEATSVFAAPRRFAPRYSLSALLSFL